MSQIVLNFVDGKLTETIVPFDLPVETQEEKQKREISEKIFEYLSYLASTDHKELPCYEPKIGEDVEAIIQLRIERRRFIRENKNA